MPAADALRRLAVWGREWPAGRDPIAAPASRRVAVLADRDDTLLEALDRARDPSGRGMAATEPVGMPTHRPRWVLCVGEGAETRRGG